VNTKLHFVAEVNPPTPEFDQLPDDAEVTFVPLEAVWPGKDLDVRRHRPKSQVVSGYTRFREGDVLVPKITPTFQANRTTRALGLKNHVGTGTTELHVVRPGPDIDARYATYLLSSRPFLLGGEAEMIGVAGQKRVPESWVRDLAVPIASTDEQRAIADFLDAETARLDSLIERKHRLVKRLGDREHFFLETVFRNQATSEVPLRRLLKVPPQYGASESGLSGEADWPRYIRITDLRDDGVLADDDVKRLPPETAHPYLLQHGDVLVARSGATVGKSIMYRELLGSACFAGYLIRLRFDSSKTLPALIELWMRTSHYWDQIAEAALQATIQNVSAEKYKELSVPVIPLAEQHQVIERLTRLRSRVRQTQTLLERQIVLLTEHRQALITAAVTGQLEVPGVA